MNNIEKDIAEQSREENIASAENRMSDAVAGLGSANEEYDSAIAELRQTYLDTLWGRNIVFTGTLESLDPASRDSGFIGARFARKYEGQRLESQEAIIQRLSVMKPLDEKGAPIVRVMALLSFGEWNGGHAIFRLDECEWQLKTEDAER